MSITVVDDSLNFTCWKVDFDRDRLTLSVMVDYVED